MVTTSCDPNVTPSPKRRRDTGNAESGTPSKRSRPDNKSQLNQNKPAANPAGSDSPHMPKEHRGETSNRRITPTGDTNHSLAAADLKDVSSNGFTKGLGRIVWVQDGDSRVVAILPDAALMEELKTAALSERELRQANSRASLQKDRLSKFRNRRRQVSNRVLELSQERSAVHDDSLAENLAHAYNDLQDKILEAEDAERDIDSHLAYKQQSVVYHMSGVAASLETIFEECQYLEAPTELGKASDHDTELERKFDLSGPELDLEDEVHAVLKQLSIEIPDGIGSEQLQSQVEEAVEELGGLSRQETDPGPEAHLEAQGEARREYCRACQEYQEAEEAFESRAEEFDRDAESLRRHLNAGEAPHESIVGISHRYFERVRQLTARISAAEASWTAARKQANSVGIDAGFDEIGFDFDFEHEPPPTLLPEDFPAPRHNPQYKPDERWHRSLPGQKETEIAMREDETRAAKAWNSSGAPRPPDASDSSGTSYISEARSTSPALSTSISAIAESAQNKALIKGWQVKCDQSRPRCEQLRKELTERE